MIRHTIHFDSLSRPAIRLCLTFSLTAGIVHARESNRERPNILFAMADDWGWPHAGAYGDKVVQTPAFDRLAKEGVLFEHAYVSSPSCTPSRNAIITGQQFYRLKEGASLWSTLDVNIPNFMFLLRDAGYQIGHWSKAWGPGDYTKGGYTEDPCGPIIKFDKFLKNRKKNSPFCFWLGTHDPHRGYKKNSGRESGIDVDAIKVPDFLPDCDTVRSDIADYYFEVQRWDRDVTKALKLLEEHGELDNTIIVMTGDHGMPFPRCKANLYEWGAHVPLAIRWGGTVKAGRKVSDFVSLTDLAPTFLDAAGVKIPEVMTGRSLMPILKSKASGRIDPTRNYVIYGRERHTPAQTIPSMVGFPARALRTDRWQLIINIDPERWPVGVPNHSTHPMNSFSDCDNGPTKEYLIANKDNPEVSKYYNLCFGKRPAIELYDCKTDPDQIRNLAGNPEYAEVIKQLKQKLTKKLSETEDPRFCDLPVKFDSYFYCAPYLKGYLKKQGY